MFAYTSSAIVELSGGQFQDNQATSGGRNVFIRWGAFVDCTDSPGTSGTDFPVFCASDIGFGMASTSGLMHNCSALVSSSCNDCTATNTPPEANAGGPYLVAAEETITLNGTGSDADHDQLTYEWTKVAGGTISDETDSGGTFEANSVAGIFDLCLTAYAIVVVHDPTAGFVTGGGWIYSPAGAYAANLTMTGKATFGFVSKYKKGRTAPIGQTEFQFKAGDLDFHSTYYEWLVVASFDKAKFKGEGTINGMGTYGFMLTAKDNKVNGSPDELRIKIWNKHQPYELVYDNQMGKDDDSYAATAIGGDGNIVVHKLKK